MAFFNINNIQHATSNDLEQFHQQFVSLIEATIPELESDTIFNSLNFEILKTYRKILLFYFKIEVDKLYEILKIIDQNLENHFSDEEKHLLKHILELRISIRQNKIKIPLVKSLLDLEKSLSQSLWDLWSGEIYILVAFALADLNDHEKSNIYNQKAIESLAKIGAHKKKLRAMHNYIASLTCIDSKKKLISDYLFIYRQSYKYRVYDLAGLALANISREFQVLGILKIADRFSKKALSLAQFNQESIHYYLICLYRVHILLDLKRNTEAQALLNYCKGSKFSEVNGAILIMEGILNKTFPSKIKISKDAKFLPGWLERLKSETGRKAKKVKLTHMEEKLILYISLKSRSKKSIIKHLYGDKIEFEYVENRFYVLISRLNKKIPDLVQCKSGSIYNIG